MLIYGINPVLEALRAGRVSALRVSARADDRVAGVLRLAEREGRRRSGAWRRAISIARRAAARTRASSPTCATRRV